MGEGIVAGVAELFLPRQCAGCGRAGFVVCPACRTALASPPYRVDTAVTVHAPVFALGPYGGAHRGVMLAAKERGDHAVRRYIGAVVGAGLQYLRAAGEIPECVTVVPAPTRPRAARLRGGDPVTAYCLASRWPTVTVLKTDGAARDQSELSAAARRANVSGRIRLTAPPPRGPIVLVDDVVTTGATLAASSERLISAGGTVAAALVIAAA